MPVRDIARSDVTRYASALEISILGERSEELRAFREEGREQHGKFLIRRLANPAPVHVVYDFVDHVRPPFADVRGTEQAARAIPSADPEPSAPSKPLIPPRA